MYEYLAAFSSTTLFTTLMSLSPSLRQFLSKRWLASIFGSTQGASVGFGKLTRYVTYTSGDFIMFSTPLSLAYMCMAELEI